MALNVDYIARETGLNLKRNITLTVASILTVVVSLTLVGISFLVRQGVSTMSGQFRGKIELIVFLEPKVQDAQRLALQRSIDANPEVKSWTYFDKDEAFAEYKKLFKDDRDTLPFIQKDILPTSFRIVPVNPGFDSVQALKATYKGQAGVYDVKSADESIKVIQQLTGKINAGMLIAAAALLAAALLLIFNTIRTAMFARRREIEVMKLVGATNWFIRIPFMLEGLIQGVLGGALSGGVLVLFNKFLTTQLEGKRDLALLQSFVVSSPDVLNTSLLVLVLGAGLGAIASGLAVGRFLDV